MINLSTVRDIRKYLREARSEGVEVAFVPTMGNLHDGHKQLLDSAKKSAELVISSIFVNPLQFNSQEDFARYPKTFEQDFKKLSENGCDVLFTPSVKEVYPTGSYNPILIQISHLANILCGTFRPNHFGGVATIIAKLFNIVQPDFAVFGLKDFQQLLIIKQMVDYFYFPIRIIEVPTVRTETGLAVSSRNSYMNSEERRTASHLYHTLLFVYELIAEGRRDYIELGVYAAKKLQKFGFSTEYFAICRQQDLKFATSHDKDLIILAGCYLGCTRLIDNLRFSLK
jgi:pantoate--beta-alanine ligase